MENEGVGEVEEEEILITHPNQVEDDGSEAESEANVSDPEKDTVVVDVNDKEDIPTQESETESAPIVRELESDLGPYWNNAVVGSVI